VIKQAILEMRGDTILPEDLPTLDASKPRLDQTSSSFFDWDDFVAGQVNAGTNRLYAQAVERMEQEILFRVLKHTNGNQLQAAKILGITRGSLRNKLRSLGIKISREIRGSTEGE
jgi:two-component system nitrogen regulation response regulator GlnG